MPGTPLKSRAAGVEKSGMTPRIRFVLSASVLAGLLAVGACDVGTPASRSQQGSVAPATVSGDVERNVGEAAGLSDYEGTVTAVEFRERLTEFEDGGFLVVDVAVTNTSAESQPYHFFDWRLQTPDGETIDPTLTSLDHLLSGDLAPGEGVEGTVVFQTPSPDGDFRVVYKPVSLGGPRALWPVNGTLCAHTSGATPGVGTCPLSPL